MAPLKLTAESWERDKRNLKSNGAARDNQIVIIITIIV